MSSVMRVLTVFVLISYCFTVSANPLATETENYPTTPVPSIDSVEVTETIHIRRTSKTPLVAVTITELTAKPPDNEQITSNEVKFHSEKPTKSHGVVTTVVAPFVPLLNANIIVSEAVSTSTHPSTTQAEVYDAKKVRKFFTVTTLCGIGVIVAVIILCGILVVSINSRADDYVS
uniref:Transmembrane protein n=1 Tax=Panagrellus redivivus TaxID=6233 RepID=A0A7E4UNL7_PANRE